MKSPSLFRFRRSRKSWFKYRIAFVVGALSLVALLTVTGFLEPNVRPKLQPGSRSRRLSSVSLMDALDGEGCKEHSVMKKAGLVIWFAGIIFTFFGLAIVTDDFFVDSLERISLALGLSDDVAGATFMAAGSSAPELFTSLIGVFFKNPEDNPGTGTIVGSAVFNITVIIGVTCLLAKENLSLDWWPLSRDSICYAISIIMLTIFFVGSSPEEVEWWEALLLCFAYIGYIIVMKYNEKLSDKVEAHRNKQIRAEHEAMKNDTGGQQPLAFRRFRGMNPRLRSFYRAGAVAAYKWELQKSEKDAENKYERAKKGKGFEFKAAGKAIVMANRFAKVAKDAEEDKLEDMPEEEECPRPTNVQGWIMYAISLPWMIAFRFTIPDSRKAKYAKWYPLTFISSILWIGLISFFMVDFADKAGKCIGISANVMGLTFLAAGTSIPDALSSVLVARDGKGDMAVANAIGSNVFDILLGLGFPWLLATIIFWEPMPINTEGIIVYIAVLFGVLIFFILTLVASKFVLRKWLGWTLIGGYVTFVVFSLLYDTLVLNPQ